MAWDIDRWDIEVRPWGWLRLREQTGDGPSVYLHYQLTGSPGKERLDLQSAVMQAGESEALSGRIWRRIPLSQIEEALTQLLVQLPFSAPTEAIARRAGEARRSFLEGSDLMEIEAPTLDVLDAYFESTEDVATVFFNPVDGSTLHTMEGDGLPAGRIPAIKPPAGRITPEFLEDLAEAYRYFTGANKSPAPAIAEVADVPVRTVHRWIYEARKRGVLPPARTGRAG
ncbi:hypothetical protein [Actinacidiphila acidipaludis]|uniref:Uncharacterized protein n=1 Tax=Actinacidiphila acidipaludis TaxID=2873382 RepID=A0ABS7Q9B8_9ACTN|nr:hypothetical protein [Streptomyces acidipaludis]MBY8879759.1 hypothetical protein [Streptomyces acidipaludis]